MFVNEQKGSFNRIRNPGEIVKTKIFEANQVDEIVLLLRRGAIVALPTETVYGLAADATNDEAIRKIFVAKGRPSDHPLIVHIDSVDKAKNWAEQLTDNAGKLAAHFWPGPLTMIFHKKESVSELITSGLKTIALRVPNHTATLEVIKKLGTAIAAPSANAYKRTSPTKPEHVLKTLSGKISGILNGGPCRIGLESTILDMTKRRPAILRPGAITASMIEDVIHVKVEQPLTHKEKVSGNSSAHYQPEKPLFVMSKDEIRRLVQEEPNVAVIHYSRLSRTEKAGYYKMPSGKIGYAKMLYEMLYRADSTKVNKILVETPPVSKDWLDINDRLQKASVK